MKFLSRLLGKKDREAEARSELLSRLLSIADEPFDPDSGIRRMEEALDGSEDAELRLDLVNVLLDRDRTEWAEAVALDLCARESCPLPILKGLLNHFISQGRAGEVEGPLRRFVSERPLETEAAEALGRHLLRTRQHRGCLEALERPSDSAPDHWPLPAIMGECHLRLGEAENALGHLRAACEVVQDLFRRRAVPAEEMESLRLEYSRIYSLMEEAARSHLGVDRMHEAFETIYLQPSNFGIQQEGDRIASERLEYEPRHLSLPALDQVEEDLASAGDAADSQAHARLFEGVAELRRGEFGRAGDLFRECLEYDQEQFAAYYGWAACAVLLQLERPDFSKLGTVSAEEELLREIYADWSAFTGMEAEIAQACLLPVQAFLPAMKQAGARIHVHPLDVRLKDIFPDRTELRFDYDDKPLQAIGSFAAKRESHIRLDEFLAIRPDHFALARQIGYLIADVLESESGGKLKKAQNLHREVLRRLPADQRTGLEGFDGFLATMYESLLVGELFGEEFLGDAASVYEECGVPEFLRHLRL